MTEQEKRVVVQKLTKRIRKDGAIKLSLLRTVFLQEGIDMDLYPTTGPKKWISDNFPEFLIMGNHGYETIRLADDSLAKAWRIMEAELNRSGKILLSSIPALLRNHPEGIDYKLLVNGQRLSLWIESVFPDFKITEDNMWLTHAKGAAANSGDGSEGEQEDEEQSDSAAEIIEIQQMHMMAYMNWWNINIKKIKIYNDEISENTAKRVIAHQISKILLGNTDILINGMQEEIPRFAFDTGLVRSSSKEPIYCVMTLNPRNGNGEKQKYVQNGFCCANDGSEWGKWIGEQLQPCEQGSFRSLEEKAAAVNNQMEILLPVLIKYFERLESGKLPENGIADAIEAFEKECADLRKIYFDVWNEAYPEECTVLEIQKSANGKNVITEQAAKAIQDLAAVIRSTRELFDMYSLTGENGSTPDRDINSLENSFSVLTEDTDYDSILKLIEFYSNLREIMSSRSIAEEGVMERIENASSHFEELSFKIAAKIFVGSEKEEYEFLDGLDEIRSQVAACKKSFINTETVLSVPQQRMLPEALLQHLMTVGKDIVALNELTSNYCNCNKVVRMLVFAELSNLQTYFEENKNDALYSEKGMEKLNSGELPTELSLWGAAERLYQVIGNYEKIAECYYILGLLFDEEKNVHSLLELYGRENDGKSYVELYNSYASEIHLNLDEQVQYLCYLCVCAPESALEYAHEHSYLMHQAGCIDVLVTLPEEILHEKERQELLVRRERYGYVNRLNDFEKAVLDNDRDTIRDLLRRNDVLSEYGYSDTEIQRIQQTFSLEDNVQSEEENGYEIGKRFYKYQKNKNSLAEYYMWNEVARNQNLIATNLMVILADENRWEECCKLYETHRMEYAESNACKILYLLSRIKSNPYTAMGYIRSNLQESLAFMKNDNQTFICDAVNSLKMDDAREIAFFYTEVSSLSQSLDDALTRSIVCMERSLREFADSAAVTKFGVSQKFASSISSIYKSDAYPHGMDAISIALRVFSMVGTYNGVAEEFAKFALPDMKAVRLLKDIYVELGDEISLLSLLQEYSVLKEENDELYLNLLFKKEYYAEFIAECRTQNNDWNRQMQLFIAELKTGSDSEELLLPEFIPDEMEMVSGFKTWGVLLMKNLYANGRIQDVCRILLDSFSSWITWMPCELMERLVTGDGTAAKAELAVVQNIAAEEKNIELLCYLFYVLHVGNPDEILDDYIHRRLAEVRELPKEIELRELQKLRVIGGNSICGLDGEISLLEIDKILEDEQLEKDEKAAALCAVLEAFPYEEELVEKLIDRLIGCDVWQNQQICLGLIRLADSERLKKQLVCSISEKSKETGGDISVELQKVVYSLYVDAIESGILSDSIIQDIQEECILHICRDRSVECLLCLYYIYRNKAELNEAEYILRLLVEYPVDNMDEKIRIRISGLINEKWDYAVPSYFELFKTVFTNLKIDEIKTYLKFVNKISPAEPKLIDLSLDTANNSVISEDDSNELIKTLYSNINDARIWKMCIALPIQDIPVAYSKVLFLNCENNEEDCELCASYCEKYEQTDLLYDTLLVWANDNSEENIENCRKYVEEKLLDKPDYLIALGEDRDLMSFVKGICVRYQDFNQEMHSLIRATALIAEKTGKPDVLRYFLELYGSEIFGQNCNLGIVLVANLIMDKRFEEAKAILEQLKNVLITMNYRAMVNLLAEMSVEELQKWSESYENRLMLQVVLPDGNTPSLDLLNEISDTGIITGHVRETIGAIEHLISMFKNDYGAYNALFNLCCTEPAEYVLELHKCLRGLICLRPSRGAMSYYRKSPLDYAKMLATLDALCIVNQWTNRISDYDFSKNTGEYYMNNASSDDKTYQNGASISEQRNEVEASFRNRNERQVSLLTNAYLSTITGNWKAFILDAWKGREDISFEINVKAGAETNIGLIRSVLRALLEIDENERAEFIDWLEKMVTDGNRERKNRYSERYRDIEFVSDFYKEGCFDLLLEQNEFENLAVLLRHPFEDYSLSGKWEKIYINSALKKNAEAKLIFAISWLIGALVRHPYFQTQLIKKADFYFEKGNDEYACAFYKALHEHSRGLYLQHDAFGRVDKRKGINLKEEKTRRIRAREYYESRYRITALFSNEASVVKDVKKAGFHTWSCLNMVLTMMYSVRADEIIRLSKFFAEKNRKLIEDVLTAFNPSIDDELKLDLIENRKDDVERLYFCYVVKHPYNPFARDGAIRNSNALTNLEVKQKYNFTYVQCANALVNSPVVEGKRPSRLLLLEARKPNPLAFEQKDSSLWNVPSDGLVREKIMTEEEIPMFADDIAPAVYEGDIAAVIDTHNNMQNLVINIEEKIKLSRIIYQHLLATSQSKEEQNDALLMFGSDCYYYALAKEDRDGSNKLLYEITRILKYRKSNGAGTEEAKRTVQEGLLILIKSAEDLQTLLKCYGDNLILLQYIKGLIMDPLIGACVAKVFSVLDSLKNSYAVITQENQEVLREELSLNYRRLEEIETNRWMEMKNRVQKLINDEINELDQRPVLQFTVLNTGRHRNYGKLFGEAHNIGKIAAENIIIQATYSDNSSSDRYVLERLLPGGKAVFELNYSCDNAIDQMDYLVTACFNYSEKTHSSTVCRGTLAFEEYAEPTYPIGLLTQYADGIMFKVNEETGDIYSPEFVGRKNETAMLRNLVEGEYFEDYKSALMYGVRRTGKTSLLNYFETYIGINRKNIISVKTDCQSIPAKDPIQYVFIDRVLDTIERETAIKTENRWIELKQNWSNGYFCADQQPEKLSLFYTDVKELLGQKGIYLIIDEIDRLFERVEQSQAKYHRNLDSLFGVLSEILNSVSCRKAVHMLICGSNWLIRYNLKGDRKNQLFQRFGKQIIEVGKLPEYDAREVIFQPYRAYPELLITEEAVKWIWDYAGGLVWHTKLLGEEAVERAYKEGRFVVYPSDVRQSMPKVITELWCRQFYEGCEDGEERNIVDAMQSLAANKDEYVHINQLSELTGLSQIEIQKIINVLIGLKIIAVHPIDNQMYRFELDIYRRYFRTNPSKYEQVSEETDIFKIMKPDFVKYDSQGPAGNGVQNTITIINTADTLGLRQETNAESEAESFDNDDEWYD